jgi:hypothetical protein
MRRNVPLLVRTIVEIVCLTDGILKFMLTDEVGASRPRPR